MGIKTFSVIDRPQDETVLLGKASYFACSTSGSTMEWLVNGSTIDHLPDQVKSDIEIDFQQNNFGHHFSTLKIVGAAEYNGTKIQCFIEDGDRSGVATMYVQGIHSYTIVCIHQPYSPPQVVFHRLSMSQYRKVMFLSLYTGLPHSLFSLMTFGTT